VTEHKLINALLFFFYLCFLAGMVFAFRAVSSISTGCLLATSFIKNKTDTGSFFTPRLRNNYLAACCLFFILQIIALLYASDVQEGLKHVQIKSALLFIPLCFYSCNYLNPSRFNKLMKAYVAMLVLAITWCLITAFIEYQFHQAPATAFFYHQLVSTLGHHAVHFSIIVFAALIYLLRIAAKGEYLYNKVIHAGIAAYFIGAILLLSSKLVIVFLVAYLIYFLFTIIKKSTSVKFTIAIVAGAGILISSAILFTNNPVSRRFNDIMHGSISIVQQTSFKPENYFNGVQFRLLQWRFVKEILQENHAWLTGLSPADAQTLLNKKYVTTNMFTGEPGSANHGFLGFNTHNQFLESLLQTGIIGLLIFIFICVEMVRMAVRQKNNLLTTIVILLLAYTLNEAVFETQYGLVIFTFLPLFFAVKKGNEVRHK
jgi:O-antigen ligase